VELAYPPRRHRISVASPHPHPRGHEPGLAQAGAGVTWI
jgi:hypothetical protein